MTWRDQRGSAIVLGAGGTAVVLLAAIAVLDLAAYLNAAVRAQAAADAAALAAVGVSHPRGGAAGVPRVAAAAVAEAHRAALVACTCPVGAREVTVEVAIAVPAVVVTRFAARDVTAHASATLVPP